MIDIKYLIDRYLEHNGNPEESQSHIDSLYERLENHRLNGLDVLNMDEHDLLDNYLT